MTDPIHVFFYDSLNGDETPLRPAFEQISGVVLLGCASTWQELRDWLRNGSVDVVAVNLDSHNGMELEVVQRIAGQWPNCGIIGVSRQTDAQSIIAAMRAGCKQFVCSPIDRADLAAAVERTRMDRMVAPAHAATRVCVMGASGGAGATTIACNLAIELARLSGRRCALADMNLEFGDVACTFDCSPKYTLADVCDAGTDLDRTLMTKALHDLPCGVSILARPDHLADAERINPEAVHVALGVLSEMVPYVVVDVPRSFGTLTAAALHNADHVLIVTQLGVPFIRNAGRLYEGLREMGIPGESLEIVLNRCQSVYERIKPEDVQSHFGKPIFATIPNDYRRVQSALDFGHPMLAHAPNTPAHLAIEQMARKLAAGDEEAAGTAAPAGLFSRFWSRPKKEKAEAAAP
jgi:pilus assembly protein CpaE